MITDLLLPLLLPMGLAFIMLALGLALTPGDFTRVARRPRALVAGLVAQIIGLPAVGLVLVWAFDPTPDVAVGILLLAACPGGVTSNFLTHLARGDAALSVSLTAVTSLAGAVTLPLVVNLALVLFAGGADAEIDVWHMTAGVFAISTLPVLAGMAARRLWPAAAARIEPMARRLAVAVFALIVVGAFASQWGNMARLFAAAGPLAMALNLATMALGFGLAVILGLDRPQRTAITMECGLQNAGLAIFVAATLLGRPELMVPALIYALWMNVSAAVFIGASLLPAVRPQAD